MEKHPYEYGQYEQFGSSISGKSQQNQLYEGMGFPASASQQSQYAPQNGRLSQTGANQKLGQQQGYAPTQQRVPQAGTTQKSGAPKPKPMPKIRALALVNTLKKSLVVASLAAFVSFGGLAAFHQVGTTA
ncbi:MAG: hypothetical protein ABI406_18060, partial [Ktedonobacteraceae bacterium]